MTVGLIELGLYVSGPVIASIFEIGDRRGPKFYPRPFHETIYMVVWKMTPHEAKKPRVPYNAPSRPWFYGLEEVHNHQLQLTGDARE